MEVFRRFLGISPRDRDRNEEIKCQMGIER